MMTGKLAERVATSYTENLHSKYPEQHDNVIHFLIISGNNFLSYSKPVLLIPVLKAIFRICVFSKVMGL